ncbi:MAG TPA: heparinase II/III family protein [Alphaproteobacteria bacterium]|nr:heparinase II/III family protein [Alphaproteobacteria bacterium]HNS44267.1 heparinase II/III family protein [Alphaproteobacteria bacterium]
MLLAASKPLEFMGHVRELRQQAGRAACQTPFYNWLLSTGETPDQLSVRLSDPWAGDADLGRLMVHGVMRSRGVSLPMDRNFWATSEQQGHWQDHIHGFSWLRDLRAAGGDASRKLARSMVAKWIDVYDRFDAGIWRADVMGGRITMWLSFFDFFCGSADEEFQKNYFASLNRQARHLSRDFPAGLSGIPLLKAARGLIYAGLSFPGRDAWILQGFECVLKEIPKQVTKDGFHASMSPENLLDCAKICLDLRYALNRAGLPVPKILQEAIERMGPALRFMCYPDRKLGLHHGGQEGDASEIDLVLSQIRGSKRPMKGQSLGGFERVMLGRSFLMMDHGAAPLAPFDTEWHSAPLSFEFMYGRDRIFTHCGGHPAHDDWQQILRHTAAHNALVIDGRPVHDIREDHSVARGPSPISCVRTENRDACLLDASHDGYRAVQGIVHRRRLFLTDGGHDLRGEDTLSLDVAPETPKTATLRFHLHPKVQVSQVGDSQDVVLTLPSGSSWRFYGVGAMLEIEASAFLGYGIKPLKTRQLVLKAAVSEAETQIKWALQRV